MSFLLDQFKGTGMKILSGMHKIWQQCIILQLMYLISVFVIYLVSWTPDLTIFLAQFVCFQKFYYKILPIWKKNPNDGLPL